MKIPQTIETEIVEFIDGLEQDKFDFEDIRFKPLRVGLGIYEQREKGTFMIRTRIPAGVVRLDQLEKIGELASLYGNGKVHLTSRQDIQFHSISKEKIAPIIKGLKEVGVITKGTGGNTPRNITVHPMSGVDKEEVFDVTPYAVALTERLLDEDGIFSLPRKYKISFAGSARRSTFVRVSDMGFLAEKRDGKRGFRVYGAGGLGNLAQAGVLLREWILEEKVLDFVLGMKFLFEAEGDRLNKSRARIRHIFQRLGEKEFRTKFEHYLALAASKNISLKLSGFSRIEEKGQKRVYQELDVLEESVEGRYTLTLYPRGGRMLSQGIAVLTSFIRKLSYTPSLRVGLDQRFYIRELDGKDVETLKIKMKDFVADSQMECSIVCAGASTCQLGLCLSQNLVKVVIKRFNQLEKAKGIGILDQLPPLYVSGCPNSCGQHQVAEIGFYGKARRLNGYLMPVYAVMLDAHLTSDPGILAEESGVIPAKAIPDFLVEMAFLRTKRANLSFKEFLEEENSAIQTLIEKFSETPSYEENPDFYKDWGMEEEFSLRGRGPGECSVGVLDIMKSDLANADLALKEYRKKREDDLLYQAVLSAYKSILVLRGVDTSKDREVLKSFEHFFVDEGYVSAEVKTLNEQLMDYKLGDVRSLESEKILVEATVGRVKEIFDSLDSKLEITIEKIENRSETENKEISKEDQVVDLRGVACPMNFVRVKLALSKVGSGTRMGFYLDDGEPIQNVPQSVQGEGHRVEKIEQNFLGYNLLWVVKK